MILEQEDNDESDIHSSFNSEEQEQQPVPNLLFSADTLIKGKPSKTKLGDIRVRYTQKTCKQATVLAQQFLSKKLGTTTLRTFNFSNIEATMDESTEATLL